MRPLLYTEIRRAGAETRPYGEGSGTKLYKDIERNGQDHSLRGGRRIRECPFST